MGRPEDRASEVLGRIAWFAASGRSHPISLAPTHSTHETTLDIKRQPYPRSRPHPRHCPLFHRPRHLRLRSVFDPNQKFIPLPDLLAPHHGLPHWPHATDTLFAHHAAVATQFHPTTRQDINGKPPRPHSSHTARSHTLALVPTRPTISRPLSQCADLRVSTLK